MMLSHEQQTRLQAGELLELGEVGPSALSGGRFGDLPEGIEGVWLVEAAHPLLPAAPRIDEVAEGLRAAHAAMLQALGFDLARESPLGLRRARPLTFPLSAIPRHPAKVNELLAIGRKIDKQRVPAAAKPGRAEADLYKLRSEVKAIDAALLPEFYDGLIDFFLETGSEHYAARQAKEALAAYGQKDVSVAWLRRRTLELARRGFLCSALADELLPRVEKEEGKQAAFQLQLELTDCQLRKGKAPKQGTLAALAKGAAAAGLEEKLDELYRRYAHDPFLLTGKGKELERLRNSAFALLDRLPRPERLAELQAMCAEALAGGLGLRVAVWNVVNDRREELPELDDEVVRLAVRLCRELTIGEDDRSEGVNKDFRANVGAVLRALSQEAFARNFDTWAAGLDGYEPWARKWFFDTFLTMEDLQEAHPGLFKHAGIVRACTKGLLLGVRGTDKREEFRDKLFAFLELTGELGVTPADVVDLILDFEADGRDPLPILTKLASEAPLTLQSVLAELAERLAPEADAHLPALELLARCAAWMKPETRARVRAALGATDVMSILTHAALTSSAPVGAGETYQSLERAPFKLSEDHEPFDVLEVGGRRFFLAGDTGYGSSLALFVDGEQAFAFGEVDDDAPAAVRKKELFAGDRELLDARLFCEGEKVWVLAVIADEEADEPTRLLTLEPSGGVVSDVSLGEEAGWACWARHQPWVVLLHEDTVRLFDRAGTLLFRHQYEEPREREGVVGAALARHLILSTTHATLVWGDDPARPTAIPRRVRGGLYLGGELHLLGSAGDSTHLLSGTGVPVADLGMGPVGQLCRSCAKVHFRNFVPTRLRGLADDELLVRDEYTHHTLRDLSGKPVGRVATDAGLNQYSDLLVRDADGDGFEEAYLIDPRGPLVRRLKDAAAPVRPAIVAHADALREVRSGLSLGGSGDLAKSIDLALAACPSEARAALTHPSYAVVHAVLATTHAAGAALLAALEATPEALPVRVQREHVRLSPVELKRLHESHPTLRRYPFASAMTMGSIEPYREHWVRKLTGREDLIYMRDVLRAHLDVASETGLAVELRRRVLELAEQICTRLAEPDVCLLMYQHLGEQISLGQGKQFGKTGELTLIASKLDELAAGLGLTGVAWSSHKGLLTGHSHAVGRAPFEQATVMVSVEASDWRDELEGLWLFGNAPDVLAARSRFIELSGKRAKYYHLAPPALGPVWPKGEAEWAPLEEWVIPEELASVRREIETLRTLSPAETTVGAKAHAALLGEMSQRFGIKVEAAAVLAAHVLLLKTEREDVAAWAGVKRERLTDLYKSLYKTGLMEEVPDRYGKKAPGLAVPRGDDRSDRQGPVFQRLFYNLRWDGGHGAPSDLKEWVGRRARRFSEADMLRAYLSHV